GYKALRLEPYRQGLEPAQAKVFAPDQWLRLELKLREPAGQGLNRHLAFDPCQRRSETEVRRIAEGEMPVVLALDVQAIRLRKTLRIAVRGSHHGNDGLALANQLAAQLHIVRCEAGGLLAGALVTEKLFHGRGHQRCISAQLRQLFGIAQQRDDSIADQVGSGLLASHHGYNYVGNNLFLSEAVSVDFGGQERVDQTFARMFTSIADSVLKIFSHALHGFQCGGNMIRVVLKVSQHLREVG